eukprot:m.41875 g.41875  ORF g.41875 m.41875 type:complete len:140 (+) comp11867_c0_seq1:196-615(+)
MCIWMCICMCIWMCARWLCICMCVWMAFMLDSDVFAVAVGMWCLNAGLHRFMSWVGVSSCIGRGVVPPSSSLSSVLSSVLSSFVFVFSSARVCLFVDVILHLIAHTICLCFSSLPLPLSIVSLPCSLFYLLPLVGHSLI